MRKLNIRSAIGVWNLIRTPISRSNDGADRYILIDVLISVTKGGYNNVRYKRRNFYGKKNFQKT